MLRRGTFSIFVAALVLVATVQEESRAEVSTQEPRDASSWVVVVPFSSPVRSLRRSELDRIYRRTTRFWSAAAGTKRGLPALPILPINLPPGSAMREDFARRILRADDESLTTYWNREYFRGVLPPMVLQSPAAVRAYIAVTPGAIGYLPREFVNPSVAVVQIEEGS